VYKRVLFMLAHCTHFICSCCAIQLCKSTLGFKDLHLVWYSSCVAIGFEWDVKQLLSLSNYHGWILVTCSFTGEVISNLASPIVAACDTVVEM